MEGRAVALRPSEALAAPLPLRLAVPHALGLALWVLLPQAVGEGVRVAEELREGDTVTVGVRVPLVH